MGTGAQAKKDIADIVLFLKGLGKPLRIRIAGLFQFESSGVKFLDTLLIDDAKVFENITVYLLQREQLFPKKGFVQEFSKSTRGGKKLDVVQPVFQEAVDVSGVPVDHFLEMRVQLFIMRDAELIQNQSADKQERRE